MNDKERIEYIRKQIKKDEVCQVISRIHKPFSKGEKKMNTEEEIKELKQQIDKLWKRIYDMQDDMWRMQNA